MITDKRVLYFAVDSAGADEPVLEAVAEAANPWNGWRVPLATFEQFEAYVAAWRALGSAGDWGEVYIDPMDGQLVMTRVGEDPELYDTFPEVILMGQTLYDLSGWCWVAAEKPKGRRGHMRVVK